MGQVVQFVRAEPSKVIELRRYVDRRLLSLRTERSSYFQSWRMLSDYLLPRRGRFLMTPNQATRGDILGSRIINETPLLAVRSLAAGLMAGLTSPARPWFRLSVRDMNVEDNTPVRLWLDQVRDLILKVFADSNAYNALHCIYEEESVFGTGVILIEEDYEDVIRCQTLTAGEYFLVNDSRNRVDSLYREYVMTVGQLVEKFGKDACSETVQGLYEMGQHDKEVNVAQAIEPNDDRAPQIPGLKGRKYRSVIWEWGQSGDLVLELKGYFEKPFCAPRWHVLGNDVYGKSPGYECVASSKSLQVLERRSAQAIDKILNPPMVADSGMKNEPSSLIPGGITYVENLAQSGFKPAYELPPNIQGAEEKITKCEERIKSAMFVDLFLTISQLDDVRTATEIVARKEEKMLMLGPFLERSQYELINPLVDRTFAVMLRAGILPPIPREIASRHIDVEVISTLADAQKSSATTGIERLMAFVGNLMAAKPEVGDNIDWDETVREYADYLGTSQKLIINQQKMADQRKARAQQAAQMQAAQTGMAAVQGAQTLSKTDVGGGQNALQMMMNGIQGAPQQGAA
jgi:hypothetical protein